MQFYKLYLHIPNERSIKWTANARKTAETIILRIESRIDVSLPYLVYNTNTVNEINPMIRKIQPNTHNVKDGTSAIVLNIFILSVFLDMFYFFLTLLMNKIYNYNLLILIK
jgi:hypothetical protein